MKKNPSKYQLFEELRPEHSRTLEADILKRGVLVPVELDSDGNVLDGHNRIRIAEKHGLEYRTVVRDIADEDAKIEHVIKLNLARRHLEPYEWGQVFQKLLDARGVKRGRGARNDVTSETVSEVAAELCVDPRTARNRLKQADEYAKLPATYKEQVRDGEITVAKAHDAVVAATRVKPNPAIEAGEIISPVGLYKTIVIDPPWRKNQRDGPPEQRQDRAYPTMTLEKIAELEIPADAAGAHVYLWTTQRFLPNAIHILQRWGFNYVATLVWPKNGGYQPNGLPQDNCAFCVLGRFEGLPFLDTKDFPTCFIAPGRKHSRKRGEFYDLVRRVSPAPRIDMFSHETHDGFDQHGLETEKVDE